MSHRFEYRMEKPGLLGGPDAFAQELERILEIVATQGTTSAADNGALYHWADVVLGLIAGDLRIEDWALKVPGFGVLGSVLADELAPCTRPGVSVAQLSCPVVVDTQGELVAVFHPRCLFVPNLRSDYPVGMPDESFRARARAGEALATWAAAWTKGQAWTGASAKEWALWRRLLGWLASEVAPGVQVKAGANAAELKAQLSKVSHSQPLSLQLHWDHASAGPPQSWVSVSVPIALEDGRRDLICEHCGFGLHSLDTTIIVSRHDLAKQAHRIHCPSCGTAVIDVRTGLHGGAWDPLQGVFVAYGFEYDAPPGAPRSAFDQNIGMFVYGGLRIQIEGQKVLSEAELVFGNLVLFQPESDHNLVPPDLPLRPRHAGLLTRRSLACPPEHVDVSESEVRYRVYLQGMGAQGYLSKTYAEHQLAKVRNRDACLLLWPRFEHPKWKSYYLRHEVGATRGGEPGKRAERVKAYAFRTRDEAAGFALEAVQRRPAGSEEAPGAREPGLLGGRHRDRHRLPAPPHMVGLDYHYADLGVDLGGLWKARYVTPTRSGSTEASIALDIGTAATAAFWRVGHGASGEVLFRTRFANLLTRSSRPGDGWQLVEDKRTAPFIPYLGAQGGSLLPSVLRFDPGLPLSSPEDLRLTPLSLESTLSPFLDYTVYQSNYEGDGQSEPLLAYNFKWQDRVYPDALGRPDRLQGRTDLLMAGYIRMVTAVALAGLLEEHADLENIRIHYTAPLSMARLSNAPLNTLRQGVNRGLQQAQDECFHGGKIVANYQNAGEAELGHIGARAIDYKPEAEGSDSLLTVDWGGGTIDVYFRYRLPGDQVRWLVFNDSLNLGGTDLLRCLERSNVSYQSLTNHLSAHGELPSAWAAGDTDPFEQLFWRGYLDGLFVYLGLLIASAEVLAHGDAAASDGKVTPSPVDVVLLGRGWGLAEVPQLGGGPGRPKDLFGVGIEWGVKVWKACFTKRSEQAKADNQDLPNPLAGVVIPTFETILVAPNRRKWPVARGMLALAAGEQRAAVDTGKQHSTSPIGVGLTWAAQGGGWSALTPASPLAKPQGGWPSKSALAIDPAQQPRWVAALVELQAKLAAMYAGMDQQAGGFGRQAAKAGMMESPVERAQRDLRQGDLRTLVRALYARDEGTDRHFFKVSPLVRMLENLRYVSGSDGAAARLVSHAGMVRYDPDA